MTGEFSTWVAAATNGDAVRALDPEDRAALLARVVVHDRIEDCDPADQAILREGWAQAMATQFSGGDWEAEDEAVGVQMKALQAQDIQWAGL